jgi:hypothetical protein
MSSVPDDNVYTRAFGPGPVRRRDLGGFLIFDELRTGPKQRTRAADRTRSKQWRGGTRRGRRQVAAARKLGLAHPFAKPFPAGPDPAQV